MSQFYFQSSTILLVSFAIHATCLIGYTQDYVILSGEQAEATISWNKPINGNWSVPGNWDAGRVPVSSDIVSLAIDGDYTVTVNVNATIAGLILGGATGKQTLVLNGSTLTINGPGVVENNGIFDFKNGELKGSGDITVNGTLIWSAGIMSGVGATTIGTGGVLTLTSSSNKTLSERTVNLLGQASWSGTGDIRMENASTFSIAQGAFLDIRNDEAWFHASGNKPFFSNAGTVRKSSGTSTSRLQNLSLNNTGSIEVQSGILELSGGGTNTGQFSTSANTTFRFAGDTFTLDPGTVLTGSGWGYVTGGQVAINTAVTPQNFGVSGGTLTLNESMATEKFNLSNGVLTGAGRLDIAGTMEWSGGEMAGSGLTEIGPSGTLTISSSSNKTLTERTLRHGGNGSWSGTGDFRVANAATFDILAGGSLDIQNDETWYRSAGNTPYLINAGILRKTSGTGTSRFQDIILTHTGTVEGQSGILDFSGGGTCTGKFDSAANSTVRFSGGTYELGTGTELTGSGWYTVSGGSVTLNAEVEAERVSVSNGTLTLNETLSLNNFEQSGGTLTGTARLAVSNSLSWTSGTMSGAGITEISADGDLTISSNNNKVLTQRTIRHAGNGNWSGTGDIRLEHEAKIEITATGTLEILNDEYLYHITGNKSLFINAGTIRKKTGIGTSHIQDVILTNTGTIEAQTGILELSGGGISTGRLHTDAQGSIYLMDGNYSLEVGSTFTGTGWIYVTGGSVDLKTTIDTMNCGMKGGNLTLNGALWTQNYSHTNGTLTGPEILSVTGALEWTQGTMSGTGITRISSDGVLTISSSSTKTLSKRIVNHGGSGSWSGTGDIRIDDDAQFNIQEGAVFEIRNDEYFYFSTGNQSRVSNAGTLRKTSTSGTTRIQDVFFTNTGVVDVQSGTLQFSGGGTSTGSFNTALAGTIQFSGGSYTLESGAMMNGSGWNRITGGEVTVNTPTAPDRVEVTGGTLTLNGLMAVLNYSQSSGTLTGSEILKVTDALNWSGGTMSGTGTTEIGPEGVLTIESSSLKILSERTFQHGGSGTWKDSGDIRLDHGASFQILAGAGLDILNNEPLYYSAGNPPSIINDGTLTKRSGTSTTRIQNVAFINNGSVIVQSGTLELTGGGTSTGMMQSALGSTIEFAGGDYQFNPETSLAGSGLFNIDGAAIALVASATVEKIALSNGTISGYGTLTVLSSFEWTRGTMRGGGATDIAPTATLTLSGSNAKYISQRTLNNYGKAYWRDTGDIRASNGAIIHNHAGGVMTIENSRSVFHDGGSNTIIKNEGLLTKTAGTTIRFYNLVFINTGTLEIPSGQTFYFDNSSLDNQVGGLIRGTGTVNLSTQTFTNAGRVDPGGSTGILSIAGNFKQTSTGEIDVTLGGLTPGTGFDQLSVSKQCDIAGKLTMRLADGYEPVLDNAFAVISCNSLNGKFEAFSVPVLSGDLGWDVIYGLNSVTLKVIHAAPDLALDLTDDFDPLLVGDILTYLLTITNEPLYDAFNVSVVNTLPDGVTFVSAEQSQGNYVVAGNTLIVGLGDLPLNTSATIAITVQASREGTLIDNAEIQFAQPDPNLNDNQATEETTVIAALSEPAITSFNPIELENGDINVLTIFGSNFTAGSTAILTPGVERDEYDPPDVVGRVLSANSGAIVVEFDITDTDYVGTWNVVIERSDGKTASKPIAILPALIFVAARGTGTLGFPIAAESRSRRNQLELYNFGTSDGFVLFEIEPPAPGAIHLKVGDKKNPLWTSGEVEGVTMATLLIPIGSGQTFPLDMNWWVPPENVIWEESSKAKGIYKLVGDDDELVVFGEGRQVTWQGTQGVTANQLKGMVKSTLLSTACRGIGRNLSGADEYVDEAINQTINTLQQAQEAITPENLLKTVASELAKKSIPVLGQIDIVSDITNCLFEMVEGFVDRLNSESKRAADRLRRRTPRNRDPLETAIDRMGEVGGGRYYAYHAITRSGGVLDQLSSSPCNPRVRTRDSYSARVRGPWDPNDKTSNMGFPCDMGEVEGVARCVRYYYPARNAIEYTIDFENKAKATDPAEDVTIVDVLDIDLDPSTLQVIASSHPDLMTVEVSGQTVTFHFENILLPPNVAPPEGEGYVTYTVSPHADASLGTEIVNMASIVFDFNPPIITPEVSHVLIEPDYNGDGIVDRRDLTLMANHDEFNGVGYDLNGDGVSNSTDIYIFSQYWEQESSIPIEIRR